MGLTDEQLARRWTKSSDRAALNELVHRHTPRVRRIVVQMTSDRAVVDDLTQDILLRAINALPRFRAESKFSTWLYRIAMNRCYDWRRKNKQESVTTDYTADLTSRAAAPAQAVLTVELKDMVGTAINRLSDTLRAAIVLTNLEGLSSAEAAEIEGCSVKTMHWRVHEARQQLKILLKGYMTE